MLLLVDPQCDFIDGTLPVPGATAAMDAVAGYLYDNPDRYGVKIATYDDHPYDHASFQNEGGPWPRHCVRHSRGGALWPAVLAALYETGGDVFILPKGSSKDFDEYSIFNNADSAEKIVSLIKEYEIDQIDICGLAGDICVLATLRSGSEILGKEKFNVLREFSPSLDGGKALDEYLKNF